MNLAPRSPASSRSSALLTTSAWGPSSWSASGLVAPAPRPGPSFSRRAGGSPPTSRRCILIVDDELDILESYARLIQRTMPQVDVRTASGPEAALAMLEHETFALIVSDFRMPKMDGIQFLERAHAIQPAANRILVSAYPDEELQERVSATVGTKNFLSKAEGPEVLLGRVREGLASAAA